MEPKVQTPTKKRIKAMSMIDTPGTKNKIEYLGQLREENQQVNIESLSNSDEAGFQADENISILLANITDMDTSRMLIQKSKPESKQVKFEEEEHDHEHKHDHVHSQDCQHLWKSGKVKYSSRRIKDFHDNDPEGEELVSENKFLETSALTYRDTQGNTKSITANPKLHSYRNIFTNLVKQNCVMTMHPIQTMIISYDSTRAISVTKALEWESFIKMYSIQTQELTFEEKISGKFIRVKEVEQDSTGQMFACVYFDDGLFRMRVFGKEQRNETQIGETEVKINELIGLDDYTMVNNDFSDPFITCCWIASDKIFVNLFHSYTLTHYHFIWDVSQKKIVGMPKYDEAGIRMHHDSPISYKILGCNNKNFPYKCFYNEYKNEIYSFYRQGHSFTIFPDSLESFWFQRITTKDLGQMVLLYGEALAVRSSSQVLFFKQEWDPNEQIRKWKQYHTIKVRGFVYFIKGNIRIQITTAKLIYFYLIDQVTFMPNLENVMYNYMSCNQMMIGSMRKYAITYKSNEKSFDIYQRKFMHNLRVCVDSQNFAGSKAVEFEHSGLFLVSKIDQVLLYDNNTYQIMGQIPIKLLKTESREPNEIIGMAKSKDENWLAVISGKNLVMNQQKQNQLFIYKREEREFLLHKRIVIKEIPIFNQVTMQFFFENFEQTPESIIFVKQKNIFKFNIDTETVTIIYEFKQQLDNQPEFFVSNDNQNVFVISTENQIVQVQECKSEINLGNLFNISLIRSIIYDPEQEQFFILCNCRNDNIGVFLIKYDSHEPKKHIYITKWKHRLEIGDANLYISRGMDLNNNGIVYKELIVSFKTQNINTYNVIILDLCQIEMSLVKDSSVAILHKHEAFQLWESQVFGILLTKSKEFLSFSKTGINVLSLGSASKRPLKDSEGANKIIHSLDSLSFLKVDEYNFLNFRCQDYENRVISIEQEYIKEGSSETENVYEDLYKIKIHEITLRELLILQSIYTSSSSADIVELIRMQPDPRFFYKTFLELDCSNMVSILAFDSKAIMNLLSEKNQDLFNKEFPIIYKVKVAKNKGTNFYYTNAIDNALKNNQVEGVKYLIKYIVKFQNNYISSFLFLKNLPILLQKGINVHDLLSSNIFNVQFDFNDWPGNHFNLEELIRPYNDSFFNIRYKYREIFSEPRFDYLENTKKSESAGSTMDNRKVYKIKYNVNLLAQIGQHFDQKVLKNDSISLMSLCSENDELEKFQSESLIQLIQYKWEVFGLGHHFVGCVMHILNTICLILYVILSYYAQPQDQNLQVMLLAFSIMYPFFYEGYQFALNGRSYMSDRWNYADVSYITMSIVNLYLQIKMGPYHTICRLIMCFIVLVIIIKTFFYLRIFPSLTPIVVMINSVIYDLRIFMFFYFMIIGFLCLVFAVLGLGNGNVHQQYHRVLKAGGGSAISTIAEETQDSSEPIASEYDAVGLLAGEFIWTIRLSMGDFSAIEAQKTLSKHESRVFWVMWVITIVLTCIIFLNFVVAEACASYTRVKESLLPIIEKEKAILISESEEMTLNRFKNEEKYPKFLIVRKVEM